MQERRASPRHEVHIAGKIISPDMTCVTDCTIRSFSENGALVHTPAPTTVPSKVYLWQRCTGTVFDCQVRWQKNGNQFGLQFIDISGRALRRALIEKYASEAARPKAV